MNQITLLPEDRRILDVALNGVIAARIKFGGKLDRKGLALSGTLSFLCNCGLMKVLGRLQQKTPDGADNAFLFYSLTEEGRAYLGQPHTPAQNGPKPDRPVEFRREEESGLPQAPLGA